MITLKRFYLDPNILSDSKPFDEVIFDKGINLIIGDKSDEEFDETQQFKMNSVGKSLFIEFINFCLLKDHGRSRVARVPHDVLNPNVFACLELEYENKTRINNILIRRNVASIDPIEFIVDGSSIVFEESEKGNAQAKEYLSHFFFNQNIEKKPTIRQLLSILIRSEKSGFDDILLPEAGSGAYAKEEIIAPHAYLFGFDLEQIKLLATLKEDIDSAQKRVREAKARITQSGWKLQDVRSYIHQLEEEVKKLDYSVEQLRPAEGATQLLNEIGEMNKQLDSLVSEKSSREVLARKIKGLNQTTEPVDSKELRKVYEKYKQGLGELVGKTLDETIVFRQQIDEFQNELMSTKLVALNKEIEELSRDIEVLDTRIAESYEKIGYAKTVTDFRVTLTQQQESHRKLESLRGDYEIIEASELEKKGLKSRTRSTIDSIEAKLLELKQQVSSFEVDLMEIHRYVYGNVATHFKIDVNDKAKRQALVFDYRTDLDGGASSDRMKTWMYDVLLMLNKFTTERHPKFLIHDNVFAAVGRNDMVRSLNYLYDAELKGTPFQYIVAINRDEFESNESEFDFNTQDKIKLELSRQSPLLHTRYSENAVE
jgi:uncharacterized protein YydD (DUF2326 family)